MNCPKAKPSSSSSAPSPSDSTAVVALSGSADTPFIARMERLLRMTHRDMYTMMASELCRGTVGLRVKK